MSEFLFTWPAWIIARADAIDDSTGAPILGRSDAYMVGGGDDGRNFLPVFTDLDLAQRYSGAISDVLAPATFRDLPAFVAFLRSAEARGTFSVALDPGPGGKVRVTPIENVIAGAERARKGPSE